MRALSVGDIRPSWKLLAAGAAAALAAVFVALITASQPLVALAIPVAFAAAAFFARRPAIAIWFLVAFSGSYGSLQAFGLFSPGPVVDLLLVALLLGVPLSAAINGHDAQWWVWPGVALVGLYIAITFLEITTAFSVDIGLRSFRFSTWLMLALPLVALAGWRLRTYEQIAKSLIGITVVVAGYAVVRLVIGVAPSEEAFALQGAGSYNVVDDELALIGSFNGRHALAFWVTCAGPFCLAGALTQRGLWRTAAIVAAGLCVAAALGTQVRAALPALIAGMAMVTLLYQISGGLRGTTVARTLTGLSVAVIVGAILFSVVLGESGSRYSSILSPTGDTSYEQRMKKWEQALEDVENEPFGKGLGTAGRVQETRIGPYITQGSYGIDSSYLKIVYEQGFPLLILFAIAMVVLLAELCRRAVRARTELVRGIAIGGAGTAVAGLAMFMTGQYIEDLPVLMLWIPLGAAIGAIAAERTAVMRSPIGAGARESRPE